MKAKGQSLVEFVIIIAVVVIGGIMVLTLLGGNINHMFTNSVNKTAEFKPFGDGTTTLANNTTTPNNSPSSNPSTTTTTPSTTTINGVDVDIKPDGSASFTIGTQNVEIPGAAMNGLSDVFMSTGSSGDQLTTEVMQAISKLINDHKDEYPGSDVPINMVFGDGVRNQADYEGTGGGCYSGEATSNSNFLTLSVGDHLIFIQKDQTFQGTELADGNVSVIDGTIKDIYGNGDKRFVGSISSSVDGLDGQIYRSDPVSDDPSSINGSIPLDISDNSDGISGSWGFTFDGQKFDL